MQAARSLKAFIEADLQAAEARAEAAVDALLQDGDAMADAEKWAAARALEGAAADLRARLEKLQPHQRQLRVTEFFTRNS